MPFIMRCAGACRAKQVVILEYALAPEHPYPAQLVQCVATLRYLLEEMDLSPGDLVLAGDSAGGQLIGALLVHLVRPSPYAPPLKVDRQFRAALFVSPFVRLPTKGGSYKSNDGRDYIDRPQVDTFMAAWEVKSDEIWANLCGVGESDEVWSKVFAGNSQGLVRKVMVTVGTAEILLDCCRVFAKEHVRAETVVATRDTDWEVFEGKDMVLVECEGEAHVQVALDSVVRYDKGVMARAIESWLPFV
jgi:acetyl esterase/lipase